MNFLKSQISIIELPLLLLMFSGFLFFYGGLFEPEEIDYKLEVDSFLDSIIYNGDFRSLFLDEDLSVIVISDDWSNFEDLLNDSFLNYEIILSNLTIEKTIYSCDATHWKYMTERIISIENNENFEFRLIRLGVCY